MGAVYAADDPSLGRRVALKVLEGEVVATGERRARFFREARGAAAATHENIAAVYEVGEVDGRVFLAMELVEGPTLRDVLARHPGGLPIAEVLRVGRALTRGLAKAHQAGVIHRDLKPENVILGEEERVKILDFGIAKLRGEPTGGGDEPFATQEGRILGTPHYMSPEQAAGRAIDERSDLFSLGVLLFEMATGRQPFDGETAMLVLVAVARDEPPLPSSLRADIPVELEGLIARCLSKDPALRPASARDVGEELRRCVEGHSLAPVSSGGVRGPKGAAEAIGTAPTLLDLAPTLDAGGGPTPTLGSAQRPRSKRMGRLAAGAFLALAVAGIWAVLKLPSRGLPASTAAGDAASATASTGAATTTTTATVTAAPPAPGLRFRRLTSNAADMQIGVPSIAADRQSFVYLMGERLYRQSFTGGIREPVKIPGVPVVSEVACLPGGALLVTGRDPQGKPGLWRVGDPGVPPARIRDEAVPALHPSPDGSLLFREMPTGLFLESLDGREQRLIRPSPPSPDAVVSSMDWSPDGSAIALIWTAGAGNKESTALEIVKADGSGAVTLLKDERLFLLGGAASVTWLDGKRLAIAFAHTSEEESGTGLYVQALGPGYRLEGEATRVHDFPGVSITAAGYDAAARRLVFLTTGFQQDVFVTPLLDDGRRAGKAERLTLDDRNDRPTGWLPDGRVLFMSDRSGNWDAFAQRLGSEPDALLSSPTWETWPTSVDDGAILAFRLDPTSREGKCPVVRREASGAVRALFEARCETSFPTVGRPPPVSTTMACFHRTPQRCLLREPSEGHVILTPFDARTGARIGAPIDTGVLVSVGTQWAISPDDREIAVGGNGPSFTIVSLAGGAPTVIDTGLGHAQYPAWTPSGAALILAGMEFQHQNYALVRADRSGRVDLLVASDNAWISQPHVSPDGKTLAYGVGAYDADVGCLEGL